MARATCPRALETKDTGATRKEAEDGRQGEDNDSCPASKRKDCDSDDWS